MASPSPQETKSLGQSWSSPKINEGKVWEKGLGRIGKKKRNKFFQLLLDQLTGFLSGLLITLNHNNFRFVLGNTNFCTFIKEGRRKKKRKKGGGLIKNCWLNPFFFSFLFFWERERERREGKRLPDFSWIVLKFAPLLPINELMCSWGKGREISYWREKREFAACSWVLHMKRERNLFRKARQEFLFGFKCFFGSSGDKNCHDSVFRCWKFDRSV